MKKYLKNYAQKNLYTPQNQPIPASTQVANSASGYSWQVSQWDSLKRFLILGSEGGTYYISEQKLTIENAENVTACIQEDGIRTVNTIVEISREGRAPKNDPAIFALALAASLGDELTRKYALDSLPEVCRTATHLFSFVEIIKGMRGWGRALRRGIGNWYQMRSERELAYQVVKYRQRNGWTHMDTLRLAHPNPVNETQGAIYQWITKADKVDWTKAETAPENEATAFIWAFEQVQKAEKLADVLALIEQYDLPREALPTQWLNSAPVWEVLLEKMPMTAMIRNLGNMSKIGLLTAMSDAERTVVARLTDANRLQKARVHPLAVLSALRVYGLGYGLRGGHNRKGAMADQNSTWKPTAKVMDALETAFNLAFKAVEPTNQRIMLALDVSGSMSMGMIAGVPGLTPREASAAMAMVTARTEATYEVISFQDKIVPLNIRASMSLEHVIKATNNLPFGATDCAQPMIYALNNKIKADAFVVYTDSETWHNPNMHPVQALRDYRDKMGIPAKLIVVGMVSNQFTIADPNDRGMLDVVGFDTAAPNIMADFMRGAI